MVPEKFWSALSEWDAVEALRTEVETEGLCAMTNPSCESRVVDAGEALRDEADRDAEDERYRVADLDVWEYNEVLSRAADE